MAGRNLIYEQTGALTMFSTGRDGTAVRFLKLSGPRRLKQRWAKLLANQTMNLPSLILCMVLVLGSFSFSEHSSAAETVMTQEDEQVFNGSVRPPQIPPDWKGESLPGNAGWHWYNPKNRLDSVRLYRGDPKDKDPSKREPYVVITKNGELIGRDGKPTGAYLKD
jgi:hypothetical protein